MAPDQAAPLLVIAGTRPELLKLAPVVRELERRDALSVKTCFSGQHVDILELVLGDVGVVPDFDLRAPSMQRTLSENLAWLLARLDGVMREAGPRGVIVQGDTNTTLAGGLVAFHHGVPCFHVEAGLRTSDPALPFPEEMNRRLVSRIAALHFAPTALARQQLVAEGIDAATVRVTGNTAIDALQTFASRPSSMAPGVLATMTAGYRKILVTLHRRENADVAGQVTEAVRRIVGQHDDVEVMWILHHNQIRHTVLEALWDHPRVKLLEPMPYRLFVTLMKEAYLIMSDSGGVQEEAPALGTPVMVLRDETERPEAVEAGCAVIVGCRTDDIVSHASRLLVDHGAHQAMAQARNPFGDGHAASHIADALEEYFKVTRRSSSTRIRRTPFPDRPKLGSG